jgi:(1->4)-alpha-D-glucan 1-alpha-D-glucosylmutase
VERFVDALLDPSPDNAFRKDFETFQQTIAYGGMLNSLAQTLLKIASPGTPDFYQGTELWDFSLTDPDNRRPVDFKTRQELLKKLKKQVGTDRMELTGLAEELLRDWKDGRIKLYVIFQALNCRRENRFLFAEGAYLPLTAEGKWNKNVCAFAREKEGRALLAIVPRLLAGLGANPNAPPLGKIWEDTELILPVDLAGDHFYNIFTGETTRVKEREGKKVLPLEAVLAVFPLALLVHFEPSRGYFGKGAQEHEPE